MTKLFNVYFKGCENIEYEGTTDNFKLWLRKHNQDRAEADQEYEHDFLVQEICLDLFEGGGK
jgi:hypothetical protein